LGKAEREQSSAEAQAHHVSGFTEEDRSRTACEMGKGKGAAEGGLVIVSEESRC
jgi:hypothetical protein